MACNVRNCDPRKQSQLDVLDSMWSGPDSIYIQERPREVSGASCLGTKP